MTMMHIGHPINLRRFIHRAPTIWTNILANKRFQCFRYASSSSTSRSGIEAIRFQIPADERKKYFETYIKQSTTFFRTPRIVDQYACYVPFWCFEVNVESHIDGIKYESLENGPTSQIYAGERFRRSIAEVLKSDISASEPFNARMMDVDTRVDVDAWHLYEATAWTHVRSAIQRHQEQIHALQHPARPMTIHFPHVISRRIMMPAHVVEYRHLGHTFRVLINGVTGQAFGLEEKPLGNFYPDLQQQLQRFGRYVLGLASTTLPFPQFSGQVIKGAFVLLRVFIKLAFKPAVLFSAALAVGGYHAYARISSVFRHTQSFEQWIEQRESERKMQAQMTDDWIFRPAGKTSSDYNQQRQQQQASSRQQSYRSNTSHSSSSYQKSKASTTKTSTRKKQTEQSRKTRKPPHVNPSDYYAVLGLKKFGTNATLDDIKKAFRRELMRYHPDHNQNTDMDLTAASERTQMILKAYRELRDPKKKLAYDRSYRY